MAEGTTVTETIQRRMTAAELAVLPAETPAGTVHYELWEGVLREMAPPGDEHGSVEGRIGGYLFMLGELQGHGRVRTGEVGIVLHRDPDTVVGADTVFLTSDQFPPRRSREGYLETIPALIVEVRSKNDASGEIAKKVAAYLAAGARAVWVADPGPRAVFVYRPGQQPVELRTGDTLTADDLIPGFAVPIADLFAGLE
jgi:Uma2 family endonuclease